MRKEYQLFSVDELRKKYKDTTQATIREIVGHAESWESGLRIGGKIELDGQDKFAPELGQYFLVTVEPITLPEGMHPDEYQKQLVQERRDEDAGLKTNLNGRKFR